MCDSLVQNRVEFSPSPDELAGMPVWLSPIFRGERSIPDRSLDFVMLTSNAQVDAFCHVADRFSNLSTVLIYKVSEASYRDLNRTLKSLPNCANWISAIAPRRRSSLIRSTPSRP